MFTKSLQTHFWRSMYPQLLWWKISCCYFCFTSFTPKKNSLVILSCFSCSNYTKSLAFLFDCTCVIVKTVLKRRHFLHSAFSELNITKKSLMIYANKILICTLFPAHISFTHHGFSIKSAFWQCILKRFQL